MSSQHAEGAIAAAKPADEANRMAALRALGILDTPASDRFDVITRIAAATFDLPIALFSIVDENRQWFKSSCGLDSSETGRDESFCAHAILNPDDVMVIEDAREHPTFANNPLVTGELKVVFYAGCPVRGPGGHPIGTLCLIGHEPRTMSDADKANLKALASWVENELILQSLNVATDDLVTAGGPSDDAAIVLNRGKSWDVSQDMLCIAGQDGYFKDLNHRFTQVLGFTRDELMARPFTSFIHEDDLEGTANEVARLAEGLPTVQFRNRYRCRDSTYRWFEWNATPVGERMYASARDITEMVAQEHAFERANSQLASKNKALEEFTSIASHDLQEPLRKIIGFADQIQSRMPEDADERTKLYLERIIAATGRMREFIRALLTMSRVSTRGLDVQRIDMKLLVADVLDELAPAIEESEAKIIVGELHNVNADPVQSKQVMLNLLSNAVKYRAENEAPVVEVATRLELGRVHVEVRDNGIGFDPAHVDKIFRPFERLHGTGEYPGNGMGLAICARIVERHGGTITATSAGKTTFTFDLEASDE